MAAEEEPQQQQQAEEPVWRYQKELPADKTKLAKAWKLLESYSGIPPDKIEEHVIEIRDKAFAIFHYPCIGRWRFLDLYITSAPEYPSIIQRLKAGDKLLDMGCCFGHILRQLAFDGAPAENLAGADLRPEFIDLGYDLFRDRGRFAARFVTGDILDPSDSGMASLDGAFDVVHTASFFHLFGWDDQVRVGERMVRLFRPGGRDALILGRQVGSLHPPTLEEYRASGERRYQHNIESLQNLWDVIGERTGTRWKVAGQLTETVLENFSRVDLRFSVTRID